MKSKTVKSLTAVSLISIFITVGCAKKNKPDDISGKDMVQDRDMSFDAQGSDSGKIEGLHTIHFDYDKSSLNEENRTLLNKDADWLTQHPKELMQIEGHCDRHGSIEYNLSLGQRRADTVLQYLATLGINKNRLSSISYGKEKMLDDSESEAADAKNRRANFKPIKN